MTYVRHGTADVKWLEKDILIEQKGDGFYEPLDLGIGKCRLMVAGLENESAYAGRLKIATKFTNTAKRYYALKDLAGRHNKAFLGAMELCSSNGVGS